MRRGAAEVAHRGIRAANFDFGLTVDHDCNGALAGVWIPSPNYCCPLRNRLRDGEKVNAVAQRTEILDPSMLKAFAKFPNRALNGSDYVRKVVDPVTKVEKEVPQQSVLVPIPEQEASLLRPASTPQPTLVAPTTPSQTPGAGRLKSIGQ